MAFPSAGTPVATAFSTSVTSMAVNMPATVSAGDHLLVVVSVRNAVTWNTIPTGFSQLKQQAGGGSVGQLTVFEKIADGTEGGTTKTWVASTGTTAEWQVTRVQNAHASTASEVASTSGDASNANPPSLTPTGGAKDYLWIAVASNSASGTTNTFSAAPTNYSGFQNNGTSSGGSSVDVATATRQLNASNEDPGTFSVNNNRFWAAATIAIYPASGASPQTITPSFVSRSASTFAMTVKGLKTLAPSFLSRSPSLYGPTMTTGAVTLAPAFLSHAPSFYIPVVKCQNTINPAFISRSPTLYAPNVRGIYVVVPAFLSRAPILYAPTMGKGPVTITPALLASSPTIYAPTVAGSAVTINPAFLGRSPAIYAPTISVGVTNIAPGFVNHSPSVYAPTLSALHIILAAFLSRAPTLYAPTVTPGAVTIGAAFIARSPSTYAPSILAIYTITPAKVDRSAVVHAPTTTTERTLTPSFLSHPSQVDDPALGTLVTLAPEFVARTAVVYLPSLLVATIIHRSTPIVLGQLGRRGYLASDTPTNITLGTRIRSAHLGANQQPSALVLGNDQEAIVL